MFSISKLVNNAQIRYLYGCIKNNMIRELGYDNFEKQEFKEYKFLKFHR